MRGAMAVLALCLCAPAAQAQDFHDVHLLANSHIRIDDGPEMNLAQLRTALGKVQKRLLPAP